MRKYCNQFVLIMVGVCLSSLDVNAAEYLLRAKTATNFNFEQSGVNASSENELGLGLEFSIVGESGYLVDLGVGIAGAATHSDGEAFIALGWLAYQNESLQLGSKAILGTDSYGFGIKVDAKISDSFVLGYDWSYLMTNEGRGTPLLALSVGYRF